MFRQNIEDYENNMKGKPKSFLSCIPDVVSYDLDPTRDDFILLSTDGIFQSMSINEVVSPSILRPISLKTGTASSRLRKAPIKSSAASSKTAKSSLPTATTWQSSSSSFAKGLIFEY